jgi:3-methyladenine DNA glycosylase AlkC
LVFRFISNGDNPEQSNIINQNSSLPDSSSLSDLTDDIHNDDKRKIRHSDSIYLLRKKVQNRADDTSDDESQVSSINEHQDGV